MAEIRPPQFTYLFSDPLVHLDAHGEEQDVECLEIEQERQRIRASISSVACPVRWVAQFATERHFVSSYCSSHVLHFTGHGIDGAMAFETETGELKFTSVVDLREMCKNLSRRPNVLFLSMCHGKAVGLAFAELGVEHVITVCNDRILDKVCTVLFGYKTVLFTMTYEYFVGFSSIR